MQKTQKLDGGRLFSLEKATPRLGHRTQFGKCSGGNDGNRRGTREQGEGREAAGDDRRRANLQHSGDRRRRHGRRAVCQMDCDVGCGAERAVRVDIGAVRMNVRHLDCARNDHEKDADYREEEPPRTVCAKSVVGVTHISPLYRRVVCERERAGMARGNVQPRALPARQESLTGPRRCAG